MANYNLTQTGDEVQAYINSIPVIDVTGTLSDSTITFGSNPYSQIAANYAADCGTVVRLTVGTKIYIVRISGYDGTNFTGSVKDGDDFISITIGSSAASGTITSPSFSTGEALSDVGIDATPTQGSDNLVKSGGVYSEVSQLGQQVIYDVSANNDEATFASLSALLSSENLSTLIPIAVRCGGMSIRFVQSSDNKYAQYFLSKDEWSASEADWEKMNLGEEVSQLEAAMMGLPQLEAPTVSNNQYPARRDGSRSADAAIHGYKVDLTLYPGYSEVTFRGICKAGSETNKVVAGIFIDSNGTVLKEVTGNVAMNKWTSEIPTGAVTLWASYLYSAGMPQTVTFSAVTGLLDTKADKSTVDELEVEVDGKADKELAYVGVPVIELMSRFYLNRVNSNSGYYVVGIKPLENGKTYRIVFSAIRNYQYNLHLVIVNTPTPAKSSTDIVTYLASFNQSNSPFSGTFEYTPNQDGLYVCVWTQGGGTFEIVNLSVSELEAVADEVEDNLVGFRNYDLFLASKKRYLTSAQQTAIGLTPNVKYNDIASLFQLAHVTDLHQDMNRFARAIKFCKDNNIMLVNTGDTVKQNANTEGLPSFIALLDNFTSPYIHCIGNHDSWGYTTEESVYNKFIAPFYEKYGWTLPSGVSNPTYFTIDDTVSMIRFIVLNQWEKYGVSTGGTHISQTQADFLISSLQAVPEGYAVIVVEHTPNNTLTRDANYPKFFQEAYSGTIGEASTKMVADIVDAWISGTSISGTYNINGSITINADFSQSASHEFIAFLNGHTHEDAITYLPNTTNRMLVLNLTTSNCYIAPSGEGTLSENGDLYRDDKSEMQDAFNVYTIDRDLKVVKVVRIGSDVPFDLGEKRDCMVIPYV